MSFANLDEDVLLQIFSLTDLYTVLSVSRLAKRFRTISLAKQLWMSVRDLARRGLMDPPPAEDSLENLSVNDLITEVKRSVVGPSTWSPDSLTLPTIRRQVAMPSEPWGSAAEFSHCGRYIIFYHWNFGMRTRSVECRSAQSERALWSWKSTDHNVYSAAFDFSKTESEALVAIIYELSHGHRDRHIVTLQVDLEKGASRELSQFDLPLKWPTLVNPRISGDFLVGRALDENDFGVLLINWRSAEFIVFELSDEYEPMGQPFSFLPNHIMFSSQPGAPLPADQIRIYSLPSLQGRWRPIADFELVPTNLSGITPIVLDIPNNNLNRFPDLYHHLTIYLFESSLHAETYDLVAEIVDLVPAPLLPSLFTRLRNRLIKPPFNRARMRSISRYRIKLSIESTLELTLRSTLRCHARSFASIS